MFPWTSIDFSGLMPCEVGFFPLRFGVSSLTFGFKYLRAFIFKYLGETTIEKVKHNNVCLIIKNVDIKISAYIGYFQSKALIGKSHNYHVHYNIYLHLLSSLSITVPAPRSS